ncbi:TAFII28-domain-containing protein [Chiua virens]|nr:TAFII28-domain-containing protein [Chiua virens]
MTTPYTSPPFIQITPSALPQTPTPTRGRGAKRGRKPRGTVPHSWYANSPDQCTCWDEHGRCERAAVYACTMGKSDRTCCWTLDTDARLCCDAFLGPRSIDGGCCLLLGQAVGASDVALDSGDEAGPSTSVTIPSGAGTATTVVAGVVAGGIGPPKMGAGAGDEDGEGEDELLPAMADDDYSAQLSWQSESKDNLKVLMDNFSPAQYDRFEAYRRHALPKQAVRRVIQQTTGQQASQPVAQIVAGFAKVFVGEIVEKARAVQARRNEVWTAIPRPSTRGIQALPG